MIEKLLSLQGDFQGHGINHEGQKFMGVFSARPVAPGKGVSFSFEATGIDGTLFHAEASLLSKNIHGDVCLWVMSSNHPGVFERNLKRQEETNGGYSYVFGFGDPEDRSRFREEIQIQLRPEGLKYTYFWGMPGAEFEERSGCLMTRST